MSSSLDNSQIPVKLLSIDGGGVRGLSAIVLLEQLMEAANEQRARMNLEPQQPWEMFDMIGGTSTGGLIAIMLGRLRMSIDECKNAYVGLSAEAFTKKNIISQVIEKVTVGAQFKSGPLETAIKSIIGSEWETALLKDDRRDCMVFVVAHLQDIAEPAILRSYRNILKSKASFEKMHIWQACRATSAALTFFEPITVGSSVYSDGGLMYNNPVQQVHGEASEMFPDRRQLLVSLGTGIGKEMKFDPKLATVAVQLAKLATETERTADDFYRRDGARAAKAGLYFRFNVPSLGDIGLEESKKLQYVKVLTEKYLDNPEVGQKMHSCSVQISEVVKGPDKQRMKRSTILSWLSNLDFTIIQRDHSEKRTQGTGDWILNTTEVQEWLNGRIGTLWCRGIRGAGKTILMSTVVQHLQVAKSPDIGLGFLFCKYEQRQEQTAVNLISSTLKQLVEQASKISEAVSKSYQYHTAFQSLPSVEELSTLLQTEATRFSRIFILIDGLDECEAQSRLTFLGALNQCPNISLFVTSQPLDILGLDLKTPTQLEIRAKNDDITKYLEVQIEHKVNLRNITRSHFDLVDKIQSVLASKADGMFLLVELNLNVLEEATKRARKRTKKTFLQLLENLPNVLDDTYKRLWEQILSQDDSDVELAKSVLIWTCYGLEPLDLAALRHAHASLDDLGLSIDEDDLIEQDQLIASCLGLVTVSAESKEVSFVHSTAGKFFTSYLEKKLPGAQIDMATACIRYLSLEDFANRRCCSDEDIDNTLLSFPFLLYAARNWGIHVGMSSEEILETDIVEFCGRARNLSCAIRVMISRGHFYDDYTPNPWITVNGLHLAAFFGLRRTASVLIQSGTPIDVTDSSGWTPLRWAVFGKQIEMANDLLAKGADIDSNDDCGNMILMWALGCRRTISKYPNISMGENSVVHIGDRFFIHGPNHKPASFADIPKLRTSEEILQRLIRGTRSLNIPNSRGRTMLTQAAENHQLGIVAQLIDHGADINLQDDQGMTPLVWALQYPRTYISYSNIQVQADSIVHIGHFISHHPTKSLSATEALPILSESEVISKYHDSVIKRLIGHDIEACDFNGRTALSLAAESHSVDVVQHLLDLGADALTTDKNHATPLMWASQPPNFAQFHIDSIELARNTHLFLGEWIRFYGQPEKYYSSTSSSVGQDKQLSVVELLLSLIPHSDYDQIGKALSLVSEHGFAQIQQLLKSRLPDQGTEVPPDTKLTSIDIINRIWLENSFMGGMDVGKISVGDHSTVVSGSNVNEYLEDDIPEEVESTDLGYIQSTLESFGKTPRLKVNQTGLIGSEGFITISRIVK